MRTLTFYSYKGGVGRTLLLANMANRLADIGKRVCVMDFDLEAPSSMSKFGYSNPFQKQTTGLVDYIYDFQESGKLCEKIESTTLYTNNSNPFTLIKAGDQFSDTYWEKVMKLNWQKMFYEPKSQGIEFLLYFKDLIQKQLNPDFLLIDTRTGITEIASITISLYADDVVLLTGNNSDSINGTNRIINSITKQKHKEDKLLPELFYILSRIPLANSATSRGEEDKLLSDTVLNTNKYIKDNNFYIPDDHFLILHSDRKLELKEELKIGYGFEEEIGLTKDYYEIFNALFNDDLLKKDIEIFLKKKQAEKLVLKAKAKYNELYTKKFGYKKIINYLEDAIKQDKQNLDAYFYLSKAQSDNGEYNLAIKSISNCLQDDYYLYYESMYQKFYCNLQLYNLEEAKICLKLLENLFTDNLRNKYLDPELSHLLLDYEIDKSVILDERYKLLIEKYPNEYAYYNCYATYLRENKKYEQALFYANKAIEIYPEYSMAYSTLAEIYSDMNNLVEFYKNFEFSLMFNIRPNLIFDYDVISTYEKYYEDERFLKILEKHEYVYTINRIKKELGKDYTESLDSE